MMLPISQQEMQKEELPREEGTLPSLRPAREPLTYTLAVTGWGLQGTLHLETNWQPIHLACCSNRRPPRSPCNILAPHPKALWSWGEENKAVFQKDQFPKSSVGCQVQSHTAKATRRCSELGGAPERALHVIRLDEYGNSGFKNTTKSWLPPTSLFCVNIEREDFSRIRINMKGILYPSMALCYDNGMLAPPNLACRPQDRANDYPVSVPWDGRVAAGTASRAKREVVNA